MKITITFPLKKGNGQHLILAKECIPSLFGDEAPKIVENYKGSDLQEWEYEPLFDGGQHPERSHYIVTGDFVTTTEGSGLVHIAPAFGQDDYEIGQKYGLPLVQLVGPDGRFVPEVKDAWVGEYVKDADPKIIENLDGRGLLFKEAEYTHQYPFCWRCDNPVALLCPRIVVYPDDRHPRSDASAQSANQLVSGAYQRWTFRQLVGKQYRLGIES